MIVMRTGYGRKGIGLMLGIECERHGPNCDVAGRFMTEG